VIGVKFDGRRHKGVPDASRLTGRVPGAGPVGICHRVIYLSVLYVGKSSATAGHSDSIASIDKLIYDF